MNISPDGMTVRFKTEPEELFEAEKSGAKPNTVRILDKYECEELEKKNPKKIIIQHQQEIFLRTITHIHVTKFFFGKTIVIFSWTNEKHQHPIPDEKGLDYLAHTMSIDEVAGSDHSPRVSPIPIAKTMRCPDCDGDLLKSRAGEFGKCAICQALFYLDPGVEIPTEESSSDEGFVSVTISKPMFESLRNFRHGRTTNYIVQELYQFYLTKQAEERGPLHD